MTDPLHPDAELDAAEINEQARSLMIHLHDAGVQFLPSARQAEVDAWQQQFKIPTASELTSQEPSSVDSEKVEKAIASPGSSSAGPASPDSASRASTTPAGSDSSSPDERDAATIPRRKPAPVVTDGDYEEPSLPKDDRVARLAELSSQVADCTRCEVLSACRKNTVFGEGNPMARFAFFGEGPGADEDRSGRPFVGRAGELLTKMITACKIERADAYIFNTVKCRPPGNRNPEPDELANCRTYYQTQLQLIQPEYIVCLGAIAAQELLQSKLPVGRLRGSFHEYRNSKVLVTYHPAYLLRNTDAKKAAWADLQMLMADAGLK